MDRQNSADVRGGEAPIAERLLVIACGALAREILAIREANGLKHLDLTCLPAELHNRPAAISERVRAKVREARAAGYLSILVGYGDCGTGGRLDAVCRQENVARIDGPHCYSFFDGNAAFAARAEEEIGAFYLTDFLARHFDTLVWRGLGLDRRPDMRDMIFGHYDRVVFLAQTDDLGLDRAAKAAADRLGLPLVRRRTGYGDLRTALVEANC